MYCVYTSHTQLSLTVGQGVGVRSEQTQCSSLRCDKNQPRRLRRGGKYRINVAFDVHGYRRKSLPCV